MRLTKDDFNFISRIISLNRKRITPLDFNDLKASQIQYKFNKINELLECTNKKIIKKRFSNFYINNSEDLTELILKFNFSALNKSQRLDILMKKLLVCNYISVKDLKEKNSQSSSSIKKDLKELKERSKDNSVTLSYKKKIGFILVGNESDIRFFFLNYFLQKFDFFKKNINIKESEYLVFNMLKKNNSSFETSKILSLMVSIQYYRIKNKEIIVKAEETLFIAAGSTSYKLKTYYRFIERLMKGKSSFFEQTSILSILSVLCYSRTNSIIMKKEKKFNSILLSMLGVVGQEYNLSLVNDKYLIKTLSSHLKSVIFKVTKGIYVQKPFIENIINEYFKLFTLLKKECKEFEKIFNIKLSNDEIIFILFHIKSSILRLEKINAHKKKVLLVCNFGEGAAKILSHQLSKSFSLNIVDEISFYQFQVYKLDKVDVIIHTVDFLDCNIKSIKVNLLLTESDIQTLEKNGFIKR